MKDNEKNIQPQAPVPGPVVPPVQTAVVQGPPATAAAPALTPTREVILAATANEPTTPAAKPVIVYRQRVHSKDSTSKHSPIGPRGTVILGRDNPGLCKKPFKKGEPEPEKLKITLIDTTGNLHKRFYPDKDTMDWDDAKMISEANKWRNQVLRRMLKRDGTFRGRTIRAKWGMRETLSLKSAIKNKVEAVGGRRLTGTEWAEVQDGHNERFAGTKVFKGERLFGGQPAKTEEIIEKRTVIAIKALFDRNADLKAFMNDLVDETAENDDNAGAVGEDAAKGEEAGEEVLSGREIEDEDETEDEDESPTKKQKFNHGGVIDPKLEEPSDDEDEGQRPVSNPVGGVLISAF